MNHVDPVNEAISADEARARLDELLFSIPHACQLCQQGWSPSYQAVGWDWGWWHGQVARCGANALRNRAGKYESLIRQAASLN